MAELRVTKFNDSLMKRLKASAALAGVSIRTILEALLTEALNGKRKGK